MSAKLHHLRGCHVCVVNQTPRDGSKVRFRPLVIDLTQ